MGAMAVSCKKEDNNADAILLTKIIATEGEGKTTSLYEYDGRKLKTITKTMEYGNESITTVYTYTYTGDDITKIAKVSYTQEANCLCGQKTMTLIQTAAFIAKRL